MARSHSIEAAGGLLPFLVDRYGKGADETFLELYKAGKSDGEIAKAFSTGRRQLSTETARQWRLRYEAETQA